MSTTKVLHVIARMNVGGTARYVSDLIENIPGSELATGYVQGAEIEDFSIQRLPVHRVPSLGRSISPIKDIKAWIELRRIINEVNPEIIHTHTFKAGLIGRLIRGPYKHVHTFHGHLFDDQSFSNIEKRVITALEKYLAKRSDVLISVGDQVGVDLRKAGIGINRVWRSIPPGVNALPLIPKEVAREKMGLPQSEVIVGWMARVTSVKNPQLLLDVARALPHTSFVMAGGGDLLDEIKSHAPKNLTIIGWADAATFWSAVDIALSTSDNEGMPIALIEAQLAGVPVIATNAGSTREIIVDGQTGYVTEKNEASLIQAIEKLVGDEMLRNEFANAARQNASEKFSVDQMIHSHTDCYESLRPSN